MSLQHCTMLSGHISSNEMYSYKLPLLIILRFSLRLHPGSFSGYDPGVHKAASSLHPTALILTARKSRQPSAGSQLGNQNPGACSLFSW